MAPGRQPAATSRVAGLRSWLNKDLPFQRRSCVPLFGSAMTRKDRASCVPPRRSLPDAPLPASFFFRLN
jgi:hypothetical protein